MLLTKWQIRNSYEHVARRKIWFKQVKRPSNDLIDALVKSENVLFRHSRENGNPGNSRSSGLPLPACAGAGFAGVTTMGTFYELILIKKSNFHARETALASIKFYQEFQSILSCTISSPQRVCKALPINGEKIYPILVKFFPPPMSYIKAQWASGSLVRLAGRS